MPVVHTEISENIDLLVSNAAIARLYRNWVDAAPAEGLPVFRHFDPSVRPQDAGNLIVLEPEADTLRYVYYGERIAQASGFDMTGRRTADFEGELAAFAEQTYRSVLASRRPLYMVAHASNTSAVVSWERLILPTRRDDGAEVIVCYSRPLVSKAEILDGLMEASMDGIVVLQPVRGAGGEIEDFRYLMVNQRSAEILGRDPDQMVGDMVSRHFPQAGNRIPVYREVMETGTARQIEIEVQGDDGPLVFRVSVVRAEDKLVVTLSDVTEMRRLLDQLEGQQTDLQFANDTLEDQAANLVTLVEDIERARADALAAERFVADLMEAVPIPLFYWNLDGTMNRANRHYAAVYGLTPESIIGKRPEDLLPPDTAKYLLEQNARLLSGGESRQMYEGDVEVPGRGRRRFVVHRALMRDPSDRPIGIAGAMLDLTDEYQLRAELERLASTDPLTGLLNRRVFMERLEEQLLRYERDGSPVSVALLDVDHFKKVNDTYGHDFGDRVLVGLAGLLRDGVRKDIDVVARFGGEEFVVLLPDTDGPGARETADRLRAEFADLAFDSPLGTRRFSASFGVADLTQGEDVTLLLKRADEALYRSKADGRNRVTLANLPTDTPARESATR